MAADCLAVETRKVGSVILGSRLPFTVAFGATTRRLAEELSEAVKRTLPELLDFVFAIVTHLLPARRCRVAGRLPFFFSDWEMVNFSCGIGVVGVTVTVFTVATLETKRG